MTTRRLTAAVLCIVLLLSGCAARLSIPATVKQVSGNGISIMQVVQAMTTAVEKAEESKVLPRNAAIKVMVILSKVTDAAQVMVTHLNLMMLSDSPTELNSSVDRVIAALEVVSAGVLQAFVPIQDEELKTQIALLGGEMIKTVNLINREILGRAYAK